MTIPPTAPPVPTAPTTGRRERKKAQTRHALRAAAHLLFTDQGFSATTIEQIAEAADVSVRTFFRYFESKDDLLLPDLDALFDTIEAELTQCPLDAAPLDAYLDALVSVVEAHAADGGITTVIPRLDPSNPAIAARLVRSFVNWEQRLTAIIATRVRATRLDCDDEQIEIYSTATATIAVATTRSTMRLIRTRPTSPMSEWVTLLRAAFAVARSGCSLDAVADR